MSITVSELCFFCGKVEAVGHIFDRPICHACRLLWAPGAAFIARPLPRYSAPRLVTYGDIASMTRGTW